MSSDTDKRKIIIAALQRLVDLSILERVFLSILAAIMALVIGSILVYLAGSDPVEFNRILFIGAFGSSANLALTLRQASLMILAGVSVAIAFRAGIFNIGVQGQMVVGGFMTTITILFFVPYLPTGTIGGTLLIIIGIIAGMLGGGLYAAIPGLLKAYAEANEVVTTIMLNFIAAGGLFVVLDELVPSPEFTPSEDVSPRFPEYVDFPSVIFNDASFSIVGFLIAILTVLAAYVFMQHTRLGYELRTSGRQQSAAIFSGVSGKKQIVNTMILSGFIAGLTGAVFIIMVLGFYRDPRTLPTFGFDAIAVSLLAGNNPLGVVPVGLLFGAMSASKVVVDIQLDISKQLVDGIIGLMILFIAAPELFRFGFLHIGKDESESSDHIDGDNND